MATMYNTYTTNGNTVTSGTISGGWINQPMVSNPLSYTHVEDPLSGLVSQIEELREKVEHLLVMMDVLVRAELVKELRPAIANGDSA